MGDQAVVDADRACLCATTTEGTAVGQLHQARNGRPVKIDIAVGEFAEKLLKLHHKFTTRIVDSKFWDHNKKMIDKIGPNNQPLIESGLSSGQPNLPGALRGNDVDVSVQVDYASLVDKAMQPPETDNQKVQRAREMLLSGELYSEKIIREAIENMLKYGI